MPPPSFITFALILTKINKKKEREKKKRNSVVQFFILINSMGPFVHMELNIRKFMVK